MSARSLRLFSALSGAFMLIIGLTLLLNGPHVAELPGGFHSSVLAFSFASDPSELRFLSGTSLESTANRLAMRRGLWLDMLFPWAYLSVLLSLHLERSRRGVWLFFGGAVTLLIGPVDMRENIVMLDILERLSEGRPLEDTLRSLALWGWLKWGLISASVGLSVPKLLRLRRRFFGALAALTALSIPACWALGASAAAAESMYLLVVFFIGGAAIASLFRWFGADSGR